MTRWVAMVQKEVGVRLAAKPGDDLYGVPSVIAQLACEVRVARSVSRTVFVPVPNVDSVLVVLERTGPPPDPRLRALIQAAFAHRRKALARSVDISGRFGAGARERVRTALEALGQPVDVRAERLGPQDFRALLEKLDG